MTQESRNNHATVKNPKIITNIHDYSKEVDKIIATKKPIVEQFMDLMGLMDVTFIDMSKGGEEPKDVPTAKVRSKKITFYHGTDKQGWKETLKQGYLLHQRGENMSPCTYLATEKEEAKQYGDYVLEVQYNPYKNPDKNNYCKDCWQLRVYEPILIEDIKLIMSKGGKRGTGLVSHRSPSTASAHLSEPERSVILDKSVQGKPTVKGKHNPHPSPDSIQKHIPIKHSKQK